MAEEKSGLEIDDWLDDLAEEKPAVPGKEASDELDQSDIDSLFGTGELASGVFPDPGTGELDQSDIDALLGGGSAPAPVSAAGGGGEGFAELDQSDIDSLLGTGEDPAPAAGDDFDLDQSDIDDLFGSAGEEEGEGELVMAEGLDAPSEDDVDQLFAGFGEETASKLETVGFAEVAQEGRKKEGGGAPGEDNFSLPDDGGFDEDEFDFGDLPDIPDETNSVGTPPQAGMGEEDIFATSPPDFLAEATVAASVAATAAGSRRTPLAGNDPPFTPPVMAGKKKGVVIAALSLLLLLGGGYWFMVKNKKGEMPVPVVVPAQEKVVAPPNAMPVASPSQWRMTQPDEPLPIELGGSDADNDPLKFEIVTPPSFGNLSGEPPKITYLANQDFPGEDRFQFRVSDGQLASCPAEVVVMGPEKVEPVAMEAVQEARPEERPVAVGAKNVRLQTLSTAPLTINWKKIWAGANATPFGAKVSVEILSGPPLRGVLHRLDRSRHLYEPERYFGGTEVVRYRFKAGGVFSPPRELVIGVKHNDTPPVLVLQPVADSYKVGDRVVLDARGTSDDSPGTMRYGWEQLAGPEVEMEKLDGAGSAVSFVVPSFFRDEHRTRIVIRVTVTDSGGQRANKEIGITPVSKRQTPLWGINE